MAMTASLFSFTAVQPVSAIMRAAERNTRDGDFTQEPNGSSTTTQACEAAWVTAQPCAIIINGVTPTVLAMWWTVIANDLADLGQVDNGVNQPCDRRGVSGQ